MPATRAGTGRRAIGTLGVSMGGYGALLLAEKYPRLISAVAAIGPAVWTSYAQARAVNSGAYASAAAFADADAVTHASALAATAVRVACGVSDPFYPGARALARVLPRGAVTDLSRGCHTGQFFAAQEPASLAFLGLSPPDAVRRSLMPDESFTEVPGERVVLRRLGWADLEQFVAYRSNEQVARYQSWDAPYPREEGERLVGQLMTEHPDTAGEWFQFAVALRTTGPATGADRRLRGDAAGR